MDVVLFRQLLTDFGQEVLHAAQALAPREADFLRDYQILCRRYPAELARAALETAILRREAAEKFPFAEKMYFTRQALEQATPFEVSTYRAGRYREFSWVADLGCSLGGDTLALAQVALTAGLDRDRLRLEMARENLKAADLAGRAHFVEADLGNGLPLAAKSGAALFFDPSRREGRRRAYSIRHYSPPLTIVQRWLPDFSALGVKVSPGVQLAELTPFDAEVEFISLKGELKEAVLWFGPLKSAARRATILPGAYTMTNGAGFDALPLSEPQRYLYEPDPAIIRAGLVVDLGAILKASQLDKDIAYLTAQDCVSTPFARVWSIEAWLPFALKRLRSYLRERRVGKVVVKKRGSPLEPLELIRKLNLRGDNERVVVLTHLKGKPIVIICLPDDLTR